MLQLCLKSRKNSLPHLFTCIKMNDEGCVDQYSWLFCSLTGFSGYYFTYQVFGTDKRYWFIPAYSDEDIRKMPALQGLEYPSKPDFDSQEF